MLIDKHSRCKFWNHVTITAFVEFTTICRPKASKWEMSSWSYSNISVFLGFFSLESLRGVIFYFSILYELGRCNGRHNYLNELSSRSIPFHFIHSARSLKYLSNLENAVNIGRAILDLVLKLLKSEGIRVFGYFGFLHFHHWFSFRFFKEAMFSHPSV